MASVVNLKGNFQDQPEGNLNGNMGQQPPDPLEAHIRGPKREQLKLEDVRRLRTEHFQFCIQKDWQRGGEPSNNDYRPSRGVELRDNPPTAGLTIGNVDYDDADDGDFDPEEEMRANRSRRVDRARATREKKGREQLEADADLFNADDADHEDNEEEPEENNTEVKPPKKFEKQAAVIYESDPEIEGEEDELEEPSESEASSLDPVPPKPDNPAIRGCIPCYKYSKECTLIHTPGIYPCQHCLSRGSACRFFVRPARKASCIECRRFQEHCIFQSTNGIDGDSCTNCSRRGKECFAGPLGVIPAAQQLRGEGKQIVSKHLKPCKQCRQAKVECSLTYGREYTLPCHRCRDNNDDCEFDKVRKRCAKPKKKKVVKKKGAKGKAKTKSRSRRGRNEDAREPASYINTSFAHPIKFTHTPTLTSPCSFCSRPSYSLFGLGEKRVEVVYTPDGIFEISGGHRGAGEEATRLCGACTLARLKISCCDRHELRRIEGYEPLAPNLWESVVEELKFEVPVPEGVILCTVCVEQGVAECCAKQEGIGGEVEEGCGLVLCKVCNDRWALFGGLDELIEGAREDKVNYPSEVLRADASLLLGKGELGRFSNGSFGEWNMEVDMEELDLDGEDTGSNVEWEL